MKKKFLLLCCIFVFLFTACNNSSADTNIPELSDEKAPEPTASDINGPKITEPQAVEPEATNAPLPDAEKPEPTEAPLPDTEEPQMTAMEIAQAMGIGLNLGNTFDGFYLDEKNRTGFASIIGNNKPENYEVCWGAPVTTEAMIQGIADAGFQNIRIPVFWGNMMQDDGTYTIGQPFIDRVAEVVDWALKYDLYCVINMHHYDEYLVENLSEEETLKAVDRVWTQLAEYFKDYPDTLIFEGFNENVGTAIGGKQASYDYANALNQTFVDAVRKTGGRNETRMLIASGYHTNIDATTNRKFVLPTDTTPDRLMVSVHYVDNNMFWSNQLGGQTWYDYSVAQLELLKNAFLDKGIPVYIGECTSRTSYFSNADRFSANAIYGDSYNVFKTEMELITDYGCVPVIWDTADGWYLRSDCKLVSDQDTEIVKAIAEKIKNRK